MENGPGLQYSMGNRKEIQKKVEILPNKVFELSDEERMYKNIIQSCLAALFDFAFFNITCIKLQSKNWKMIFNYTQY